MTAAIDPERLGAYVDGELGDAAARAIEEAMAASPELRRTVEALREASALARAAFNAPLREPVPERLLATIDAGFAARARGTPATRPPRASRWPRYAVAAAASFAVVAIGLGGGYLAADFRIEREIARLEALRETDRAVVARTVNDALEKQLSGTAVEWRNPDSGAHGTVIPVRTYRSESGKWCREYTAVAITRDGARETRRAVACREGDGMWKTRAEFFIDS